MFNQIPNADMYLEGTPERAVAAFLCSWAAQDWPGVFDSCTVTYKAAQPKPVKMLQAWFSSKELVYALICEKRVKAEGIFVEIEVHATYNIGRLQRNVIMTANVIREKALRTPSPDGVWGVNPISIQREKEPEKWTM